MFLLLEIEKNDRLGYLGSFWKDFDSFPSSFFYNLFLPSSLPLGPGSPSSHSEGKWPGPL